MFWDESLGPKLEKFFPGDSKRLPIEELGVQLFQTTVTIYGHGEYQAAEGALLRIVNVQMDSYLFFDTIKDANVRGGERQFMLCYIAPKINILESLRIKEIFETIATQIKENKDWKISEKWKKIALSDISISHQCCNVMKKRPFRKYEKLTGKKPLIGNLAQDSSLRKAQYISNGCNSYDTKNPSRSCFSVFLGGRHSATA